MFFSIFLILCHIEDPLSSKFLLKIRTYNANEFMQMLKHYVMYITVLFIIVLYNSIVYILLYGLIF